MAKNELTFTRITNASKQMIPVQVRRPNGDFFLEERQVRIPAGRSVTLPTDHLMPAQIENLKVKRQLQVSAAIK
jgi:hypothetical protein